MLASSVGHTTSNASQKKILKHKLGQNSHRICSNLFIFVLLLYDIQATNFYIIIKIGVLGIITSCMEMKNVTQKYAEHVWQCWGFLALNLMASGSSSSSTSKSRDQDKDDEDKILYAGNLHSGFTKEYFQKLFEIKGHVEKVELPVDEHGNHLGFGLIHFYNSQHAKAALDMNLNLDFETKTMKLVEVFWWGQCDIEK